MNEERIMDLQMPNQNEGDTATFGVQDLSEIHTISNDEPHLTQLPQDKLMRWHQPPSLQTYWRNVSLRNITKALGPSARNHSGLHATTEGSLASDGESKELLTGLQEGLNCLVNHFHGPT